jgi:hypothetical protein
MFCALHNRFNSYPKCIFVCVGKRASLYFKSTLGSTTPDLEDNSVKVKVTLRPTVSLPVRLGVRNPSGTRDQFFFLLEIVFRQLRVCYFVAPSLMRGRVCNLLLLLVVASAVPLGSESH